MDRTIKTRAMTGSLYGQVPSAAMDDVSDEDGGQSDSQPGGYAVEEPDGASPHKNRKSLPLVSTEPEATSRLGVWEFRCWRGRSSDSDSEPVIQRATLNPLLANLT